MELTLHRTQPVETRKQQPNDYRRMNTRMEFHPMQVCLALMTFQFPITRTGSKAGSMPLANGSVASSMFAQEDRSSANWTGKINKTGPAFGAFRIDTSDQRNRLSKLTNTFEPDIGTIEAIVLNRPVAGSNA